MLRRTKAAVQKRFYWPACAKDVQLAKRQSQHCVRYHRPARSKHSVQRPVRFHVYIYIILNTKLRTLKFMTRRKKEETVVSHFKKVIGEFTCEVHTDAIVVKWRTSRAWA